MIRMTSPKLKLLLVMCCAVCIIPRILNAQLIDRNETDADRKKSTFQTSGQSTITPQNFVPQYLNGQNARIAVMDGPVDPREYYVGPGDIYGVNVWISPPLSIQLPVTPEGSLIMPTVGEIFVSGLHLDEAKKKVISEIKKKYISNDASFTLLTPRIFAVTVKGVVRKEGTVYIQATERVDAAVALANTLEIQNLSEKWGNRDRQLPSDINLIPGRDTVGSSRKIVIQHKDGTRAFADFEKYFSMKDSWFNPYLKDGDVVIVPKRNIDRDFVGVYGAVNKEDVYEYVPGDSLISMIRMARGLSELADSEHVQIIRSDSQGKVAEVLTADLGAIGAGRASDVALQRGDRILVKEKIEMRRDFKVYIEGEVYRPGFYPITRDSAKLSECVQIAGGFTENALLGSSRIFRTPVSDNDLISGRLENMRGVNTQEDTIYFSVENAIRESRELVVADFVGLFVEHDKTKDVYLHDGDHIVIASKKRTVYVFGQVVHPGHVSFTRDKKYAYYVDMAGGLTEDAVKGDIRIIKANTKQWLSPGETAIEEGDYVWVPKEPYRTTTYYYYTYSQIFGIIGTIATLVLLIVTLKK